MLYHAQFLILELGTSRFWAKWHQKGTLFLQHPFVRSWRRGANGPEPSLWFPEETAGETREAMAASLVVSAGSLEFAMAIKP